MRKSLALLIPFLLTSTLFFFIFDPPKEARAQTDSNNCIDCHTNAGKLISILKKKDKEASSEDDGGCAVAPTRSRFLNFFVNKDFIESTHGSLGCTTCHGGDKHASKPEIAHYGMRDTEEGCAQCHDEIVQLYSTSLHSTLHGQDRMLRLRAKHDKNYQALEPVKRYDCNTCHAGCGDCHVNIPKAVGGGLISGHQFFGDPPMESTCVVCHGSRAGGEYIGTISEDIPADVHFMAGMTCTDCHAEPMHGDGHIYESRWDVEGLPDCTDCHDKLPNSSVAAHTRDKHAEVSCQVCHSLEYKNCFDCHASIDEKGEYHRIPRGKSITIKIGLNTVPNYPYKYVPLRHNPVSRDAFIEFGEDLLPDFDAYPTWKTAAPHNIQRVTSQNRSCDSCHKNDELFIKEVDLAPGDSRENIKTVAGSKK
jgi:thiosulfate/3-mercaptopyruvate sulfurtransferase